jgi:hypothetical protein
MEKITVNEDNIFFKKNFLKKQECDQYIKIAKHPSKDICKKWSIDSVETVYWEERLVDISDDPLSFKIKKLLEKQLKIKIKLTRAQIQTWMPGTHSYLHDHEGDPSLWNTVVYLNSDFKGGDFYTSNGISIKPEIGLLILFNGKKIMHGVRKVKNKNRYTLIFWWKKCEY